MAHWCLGLDYAQMRKYRMAVDELQKATLSGGPHNALAATGYAYAMMGDREKAEHSLRELKRLQRSSYTPPYAIAAIYAGLGENDAAFEWLGRSQKAHDVGLVWLKWDPQFDNIRTDSRFQGVLSGIGLQSAVYSTSAAD